MKAKSIGAALSILMLVLGGCQSVKKAMVPVADTPLFEVWTRAPLPRADNQRYYDGDNDRNYYRYHDKSHGKNSPGKRK